LTKEEVQDRYDQLPVVCYYSMSYPVEVMLADHQSNCLFVVLKAMSS